MLNTSAEFIFQYFAVPVRKYSFGVRSLIKRQNFQMKFSSETRAPQEKSILFLRNVKLKIVSERKLNYCISMIQK